MVGEEKDSPPRRGGEARIRSSRLHLCAGGDHVIGTLAEKGSVNLELAQEQCYYHHRLMYEGPLAGGQVRSRVSVYTARTVSSCPGSLPHLYDENNGIELNYLSA